MEKRKFSVFIIVNKADNNKCYVGMTTQDVNRRVKKIKNGGKATKIALVLNEFRESCFDINVPFVGLQRGDAINAVNELITKYDSINNGYNTFNFRYHTSTKPKSNQESLTCKVPKGTKALVEKIASMCGTTKNTILCAWIEEKLKAYKDML